jgi:nicotinate-nucleotide pyrophosphorylase (carboxylating)
MASTEELRSLITRALQEDIGSGDVTTNWIIPAAQRSQATITAKAPGVIAGLEVVREILYLVDERIEFTPLVSDGDSVKPKDLVAQLSGPTRGILSGERVLLNFLQHLSGIATATRAFVDAVAGAGAIILDTRKTTPGLRTLEKYAVRMGGGTNHRIGLYDMVLIKDNHIDAAGSISEAVRLVRAQNKAGLLIEVETRDLREVREALALKVDRILLDNMSCELMRQAVALVEGRVPLEASGNVTLDNVRQIAETGVNYISSGSLTHSAKALDLSLTFVA